MVPYGTALQQLNWRAARLESGMDGVVWFGGWKHKSDTAVGKYRVRGDLHPLFSLGQVCDDVEFVR